jgi:hypothetical protein
MPDQVAQSDAPLVPQAEPDETVIPSSPDDQQVVASDLTSLNQRHKSLQFRSIQEIEPFHDYAPGGNADQQLSNARMPEISPLPVSGSVERAYAMTEYQWEAANVFHNPLYFEDMALERYGHAYPLGIQPVASLAKFGVQVVGLPYQMALDPVCREHYALGYYRPGDCAPKLRYQIPWNTRAAATATGVYTGMFFIFP